MVDKRFTPPPRTASASPSNPTSPLAPNPKRAKMSSPDRPAGDEVQNTQATAPEHERGPETANVPATNAAQQLEADDDVLEADNGDADSAFGSDNSDTTSLSSSIYRGYVENGRRYQTVREGEYWGPSDEKQFEAMQAAHIVYKILDSQQQNPLFRSPIPDTAQNILDIGTGNGIWACEVADMYPGSFVQGIDLSPPPDTWVPPNCKFEVDDVLKTWMFNEKGKFDLIHMRDMYGSFTDRQWTGVYKQAFENLAPGGWIEQLEPGIVPYSDDGSLNPDSLLAESGPLYLRLGEKMGKPLDTIDKCKARIEAAGFTNIHEKWYKVPLGEWVKNPILKEAGKFAKLQLKEGIEGYCMFLFTRFGEPTPWTPEQVQVYLAKWRKELETPGLHAYYFKRRVWAQKPLDSKAKA